MSEDKYEVSTAVNKIQAAIKNKWKTIDPEPWDKCRDLLESFDFDLEYVEAVIRSMPKDKKSEKPYHEWVKLYAQRRWVNKEELKKSRSSRVGIDPETGETVIYGRDADGREYMAKSIIDDPFKQVKKYPKIEDSLVCQESIKTQFDTMFRNGEISADAYELGVLSLRFLPNREEALKIKEKIETTQELQKRRASTWTTLRDSPIDDDIEEFGF